MSELEGLIKTLEIYSETEHSVTQGFYQSLCVKAKEAIEELSKDFAHEVDMASQANACCVKLRSENGLLKTQAEAEKRKNIIAKEFHDKAEAMIKKLEAENEQHRWIPVSERLPEKRTKVLTLGPAEPPEGESEPAVAWMGEDGETWWTYGNNTGFYKPTHWKPIVLPEQETKVASHEGKGLSSDNSAQG